MTLSTRTPSIDHPYDAIALDAIVILLREEVSDEFFLLVGILVDINLLDDLLGFRVLEQFFFGLDVLENAFQGFGKVIGQVKLVIQFNTVLESVQRIFCLFAGLCALESLDQNEGYSVSYVGC